MLESILAHRLDLFLFSSGHTDPCQEGFTRRRNTVRYLNRLHLSIKGDIDKKLTVLCLFLDMEKAFDSVWKKGLIAKLYQYGVNGHFLQIINDFLMNRRKTIFKEICQPCSKWLRWTTEEMSGVWTTPRKCTVAHLIQVFPD